MNKYAPLVSVLMTAYNREKYIAEAIESVLASSYTNFELIIVDDGSKDNTVEIAKSYEQKDRRIKLYINEKNVGDYPNRNIAASYARGKYIKYLDADDIIYPLGLSVLVTNMEANPTAGWGLCTIAPFRSKPFPILLSPYEAYWENYKNTPIFSRAPTSSIIKKEVFDRIKGFTNFRMVGDFEMWHKLALSYPVLIQREGIIWYRRHDEQEMNSQNLFTLMYEKITLHYLRHQECPLSNEEVNTITKLRIKQFFKLLIYDMVKFRINSVKIKIKIIKIYFSKNQISLD